MSEREPQRKRLLILGCPRSGTRFITGCMRNIGVRIQHERMGNAGVSSCWFVVDDEESGGEHQGKRSDYLFDQVWHQLRDPRKVIPSMAQVIRPYFWRWQMKHTGIDYHTPKHEMVSRFWLDWTSKADNVAGWRYRIEDLDVIWPEMLNRLNEKFVDRSLHRTRTAANARQGITVTWDDIVNSVPSSIVEQIEIKAKEYGYE